MDKTAGPPPAFWSDAAPEEIERTLLDHYLPLDAAAVQAVRLRSASYLLSDATISARMADALMTAVRRRGKSLPAGAHAAAWRCLAEARLFTGRMKSAGKAYAAATREAEAAGDDAQLGQILVGRVHHLSLTGEVALAESLARRAERLLAHTGDLAYLGKLHMNRGNAFYQKDRYRAARLAYGKAARFMDRAGLRDAAWYGLLMNQGIAAASLAHLREARSLFLQVEQECVRKGYQALAAQARFNRAELTALRGDYRSALRLLEEAGEVFDRQQLRDLAAAAWRSRAEIYLELSMGEEAHNLALAAAEAFDAGGMTLDANLARLDRARSLLLVSGPQEALSVLRPVLESFERDRLRPRVAETMLLVAEAELMQGEATRAARAARESLRLFRALHLRRGQYRAQRRLAESLLAERRLSAAERTVASGLKAVGRVAGPEAAAQWHVAGRVALAAGKRSQAAARLRRAAGYIEQRRRLIPGVELRAHAFESQVTVYRDLLRLTLESRMPRFETLFGLVERARARGFRERLAGARTPAWERIAERRAELGSITRRVEEIELAGKTAEHALELAGLRRQAMKLERALIERIHRAEAGLGGDSPRAGTPAASHVARRVREGEALIEYFVVEGRVLALVLRRGVRAYRVLPESADEIRAALTRFQFQVEAAALSVRSGLGDRGFLRRSAEAALKDLQGIVIAPLSDLLVAADRLTVVPHSFLHGIPFECLAGAGTDVEPLIQRAPTADFLLRRNARRASPAARIFGLVNGGPAFIREEIDTVARCLGAAERDVIDNPTSAQILAALPEAGVVHIATHGAFRRDNPLFSRLSTSGGALFVADILQTEVAADLVVLSACETGRTHAGLADELAGVAHAFLAGGARHLIAGHWRIHGEATRAWMEAFYTSYAGPTQRDPAAALRRAQRAVRESWNHPFFWGSFGLYGA